MRLVRSLPFRTAWLTSAAVLLSFSSACSTKPGAPEEKPRQYSLRGVVVRLDPKSNLASIKAEKIDGWMDAMTMEYPVKPDADWAKLHAGDHIEATVVVQGQKYYVTGVKVVSKK